MLRGSLLRLQEKLKLLPGVGVKSAQRLALYLIGQNKQGALELASAIQHAVDAYQHCKFCNSLTETNPCEFCADSSRDSDVLCIVQNTIDLFHIEQLGQYQGKYFVLGGLLSPIDGIGPDQIHYKELCNLINSNRIKEVILALNPTTEGESTMQFLADQLSTKVQSISRLSTGLPFGGDLEYAGQLTLQNAFKRRYSVIEPD